MKLKLKMAKREEYLENGMKVYSYEMATRIVEGEPGPERLGHLTIQSVEPIPMLKVGAVIDVTISEGLDIEVVPAGAVGRA